MDGDTGAAAAPAAAPSNGDVPPAPVPAAPPVEEETKGDGRAAEEVEEKMEEGEEEPAAATKATTTNAPPAPPPEAPAPARSGPFSSTVIPRTVDAIAEDHFKRRSAILRALTDDQDAFFAACDPSRENLCLYGEPGGGDGDGDGEGEAAATWRVAPPADEVPPEIPEPCLGINFARDGMRRSDWVALVAVHSDAWLRSVAWYFGARLDKAGRAELFAKLNSRPSLYEVATGRSRSGLQAKMQKKAAAEAAANKANGGAANGGALPPPPARRQPGADPDEGVVLGAGGARAASAPLATGRLISSADAADPTFTAALVGRRCELLWPDDGLWYLVEILEVDSSSGASAGTTARARYSSGEEEVLSLQEVAEKGELSLLAD